MVCPDGVWYAPSVLMYGCQCVCHCILRTYLYVVLVGAYCVCVCVCVCVCACVRTYVRTYMCIPVCICTYVRTYVGANFPELNNIRYTLRSVLSVLLNTVYIYTMYCM